MTNDEAPHASDDAEDPADLFALCSSELLKGIDEVFVAWIVRCVAERAGVAGSDSRAPERDALLVRARAAGAEARDATMPKLRDLMSLDVEHQSSNPMSILREAVRFPTNVLADAGVPPKERDEFAQRWFPGDDYDLAPAGFVDIDPSLHELGLRWGAAKAHLVLTRRSGR